MPRSTTGNRILDSIPDNEFAAILPILRTTTLRSGEILYHQNERIEHVFFPTSCVLSVITVMQDGSAVEIGTYGREGMSGAQILLGSDTMPSQMLCQVPGESKCMTVTDFSTLVARNPALQLLARQYTYALFNFMGQSVACNRLHETAERCARWLASTQDRVGTSDFLLTQEFLAIMLGVQRPSVSIAAGALQEAGFIKYSRGRVVVTNRKGLESAACECYSITAEEFEKALTVAPTSDPIER